MVPGNQEQEMKEKYVFLLQFAKMDVTRTFAALQLFKKCKSIFF